MNRRPLVGAMLVLGASGCARERFVGSATEVVVVVATDLVPVGEDGDGEIDAVHVVVGEDCDALDRGGAVRTFDVGPEGEALPLSFGITPSRAGASWCARIEARRAGRGVIAVVRSGSFRDAETIVVGAYLSRACIDVRTGRPRSCPEGETCGAGGACVAHGLAPSGAAFDPTFCAPDSEVACVTREGGLGHGTCGADGSPPIGSRCRSVREIPGNGLDDDGRPDTPDDGACSPTHPSGARRVRGRVWDTGWCARFEHVVHELPRWENEVCLAGGRVRLGDADGVTPFADPTAAGLGGSEPSAVPADESPSHVVVVPAFWADAFEVSFCRFAEFWHTAGESTTTPRLEPGDSPRCAGCVGDERCFVRNDREAFCIGEPMPLAAPDNACAWAPHDPRGIVGGVDEGSAPINCMPWLTAQAFCEWDGAREGRVGRLPTEAEWERMARGLDDGERIFPWGDDPPRCDRAYARVLSPGDVPPHRCDARDGTYCGCTNLPDAANGDLEGGANLPSTGPGPIEKLALLGLTAPNSEGLFHLAGNVAEWTYDAYRRDAYAERCGRDGERCAALTPFAPVEEPAALRGGARVVRGGSWQDPPGALRVSARAEVRGQPERDPENPDRYDLLQAPVYNGIGFRCVREP
ncbi:MAG: SUMF1/EgtB/PvdO family nonheme iron enzyme [Deltaproteobacteria bacterium]|nr:SUMF1/EgtB/PvdO family nonheme iron enzyme [Deltaproteobacteria bacterium]